MAAGDVTFSTAVDGVCVPCCPGCGPALYGTEFDFIQSGTASCGCVFQTPTSTAFLDGVIPTNWTFTWDGTVWTSPPQGSADLYTGTDCTDLSFFSTGTFGAVALCTTAGEHRGELQVNIGFEFDNGGTPATSALCLYFFTALGQTSPNDIQCVGGIFLAGGGDGTI